MGDNGGWISFTLDPTITLDVRTLPWRTRLRLRCIRAVDRTAGWLADHQRERLAILLWRACCGP